MEVLKNMFVRKNLLCLYGSIDVCLVKTVFERFSFSFIWFNFDDLDLERGAELQVKQGKWR